MNVEFKTHFLCVSPAQLDGSSCGVHACINSYFFMNEGRLATTADYTPNANGCIGPEAIPHV